MGQPGNPNQIRQGLGLRVHHHLDNKIRPELRNPKAPHRASPDIIRRNPKRRRIMEQGNHPLIVQRDIRCHKLIVRLIIFIFHGRRTDILLQGLNHRRVIMPQDIKLQQVVVNGMVVKMGGHDIRIHVVRRMLHRRKGINLLS